jgi:hypothetical protein
LHTYRLTQNEVQYVTYSSDNKQYYCSLPDFLTVTKDCTWAFDLWRPYDVQIVGDNWWFSYDHHGMWIFHKIPIKPDTYQYPPTSIMKNASAAI